MAHVTNFQIFRAPSKDGSDSRDSPAILRNAKEKKKKTSENVDVIITADLSPPTSPPVASEAETVGGNNMLTANGSQNSGSKHALQAVCVQFSVSVYFYL